MRSPSPVYIDEDIGMESLQQLELSLGTVRIEENNPSTDYATTPYPSSSGWDTREGSTMADAVESEGNHSIVWPLTLAYQD
jgi:hypothetical protein